MAQRPTVPQFGKWESEENIPYTVYFDKARKNRGGRVINPNDPQENPQLFQNSEASNPRTRPPEQREYGDGNHRQSPRHRAGPPTGHHERSPLHPAAAGFERSPIHHQQARVVKATSVGSDQGLDRVPVQTRYYKPDFERSPLHHQAKFGGTTPSRDSSHGSGGKSRMRTPSRGDETVDQGTTVPPFGHWNLNDPDSAEQYTAIFDKIHDEKVAMASNTPKHPSHGAAAASRGAPPNANQAKACCFPWW